MIRHILAAAALLAPIPALAQSQQEALDARYDRALAAGYKALFLCSAIANAERAGAERTPESVTEWELAGIQAPLDTIVPDLPFEVVRGQGDGQVSHVRVAWADDMPPRIADHDSQRGCHLLPIGGGLPPIDTVRTAEPAPSAPLVAPPGTALARAMRAGFSPQYGEGTRTTAVLVRRDGETLGEIYADGFGPDVPQRTWSVAKSIAATLVGAAVQRGDVDTAQPAGLGQGPADARSRITIDHLLRMASGRYSDTAGNRTDPVYFGGASVDERAATWPLIHPPGTVYRYANNDTLMAIKAIEGTFEQNPPEAFFARLGMTDTVAERDWQGNYILSSQVWSTARDLATLGQLYLDDGMWNGERVLPEGWARYVSSPSGPQPDGPFGYGAGFWLFNDSDGVPPDTYAAMGNRGQFVVIVPSRDVVIVRRGEDPAGTRFDIAAFTRDVLAATAD
ncbi:serine hydrolase [Pelagerythrobacter marensis]|uniref:Serine hydrolase n=1 Tax=Pelagerythrobacter marensis TaxID=543877 RepID=A0ABZ2D2X8_9SPHN